MQTLTATQARKNIYQLLELLEKNHETVQITGKTTNAILITESDWNAIQETLYLLSVPGMRESIKKGLKIPIKKCGKDIHW